MRILVGCLLVATAVGLTSVLLGCGGDRRESFYPSLADADKAGQLHTAGYQTTYSLAVLGPFMRFMKSRQRRNGVPLSFFPLTRKAFERISRVLKRCRRR